MGKALGVILLIAAFLVYSYGQSFIIEYAMEELMSINPNQILSPTAMGTAIFYKNLIDLIPIIAFVLGIIGLHQIIKS